MKDRLADALPRAGVRIVLRRLRPGDLAAFQAYRHDPVVGRYQGWIAQSDRDANAFLEQMYRIRPLQFGTWTQLAIARREDDGLIGDIGIRLTPDGREAEIGFTLGRAAQRQGLATEAVTAACALTFELSPAHRIVAVIDTRNGSAIRLVERIGMRCIATAQADFRGEPCLEHTYELTRPAATEGTTGPSDERSHATENVESAPSDWAEQRSAARDVTFATSEWTEQRAAARGRHAARYDQEEARDYAQMVGLGTLGPDEQAAYLADILRVCPLSSRASVLDVGAGNGALCSILAQVPGLDLTALEPSPAMLELLRGHAELAHVKTVTGHTDGPGDVEHFAAGSFDVVASRQVVNGLFDPLAAFRHWHRWLRPGGAVLVIDGLYGRDAWRDDWAAEIDVLPLSAVQTLATVPYLLEAVGFTVETVERMPAVNALVVTRTPRYVVVARR